MFQRKNFSQKIFLVIRGFPEIEKLKLFDFFKTTENALNMILRPKWGDLGENE